MSGKNYLGATASFGFQQPLLAHGSPKDFFRTTQTPKPLANAGRVFPHFMGFGSYFRKALCALILFFSGVCCFAEEKVIATAPGKHVLIVLSVDNDGKACLSLRTAEQWPEALPVLFFRP